MKKILLFFFSAVVTISSITLVAQNKSLKNIKQEKLAAQKDINETSRKIKQNTKETKKSLNQLNLISAEIKEQDKLISSLSTQLTSIDSEINKINDTIAIHTKQLDALKANYAIAVKKVHSSSSSFDKIIFIFSADSFRQAYRRLRYLNQFSEWREKQTLVIKDLQTVLSSKKAKLKDLQESKNNTLSNVNTVQKSLENKKKEQSNVVDILKDEGQNLKTVLRDKEKQSRALDRELERLIAEEERKAAERARIAEEKRIAELKRKEEAKRVAEEKRIAEEKRKEEAKQTKPADKEQQTETKEDKKEVKKKEEPKPVKTKDTEKAEEKAPQIKAGEYYMNAEERSLSGNFESNKGRLLFPISGRYKIVKHFGRQRHPELKYVETNNGGIDIETSPGASARAVFNGKITGIFDTNGFNKVVMVRHGNYLTIYANLSDIYVQTNQEIKAGQSIGKIFADPEDDNRTILHFEIRKEKVKLNPELWIK